MAEKNKNKISNYCLKDLENLFPISGFNDVGQMKMTLSAEKHLKVKFPFSAFYLRKIIFNFQAEFFQHFLQQSCMRAYVCETKSKRNGKRKEKETLNSQYKERTEKEKNKERTKQRDLGSASN